MKSNKLLVVVSTLLVLSLLATGCARPTPQPSLAARLTQEFMLAYNDAAAVYSAHVTLDSEETRLVKMYVTIMDNIKSEVADELAIMDLCYTNTDEFFVSALTAAFGEEGIGGEQQEVASLINALVLNETYPGDISLCQQAAKDIAIYMRSHRAEAVNTKGEIFRVQQEITKLELGDLKTAVIIDFYNKYGADLAYLIQSGDQAFAEFVGSRSENQRLPAQFFGFPTKALQAQSRNLGVCKGYQNIYEGRVQPPFGKYAYQYGVSIDPVAGTCTLYQAAAEGYISMITLPSQASLQDIESGCTSVVPGGCDEQTPNP